MIITQLNAVAVIARYAMQTKHSPKQHDTVWITWDDITPNCMSVVSIECIWQKIESMIAVLTSFMSAMPLIKCFAQG